MRTAGFEGIVEMHAEFMSSSTQLQSDNSGQWIDIGTEEFCNDPHEFMGKLERSGDTVLTHHGSRYISTDIVLRNTYEGIHTVQNTFDRESHVTHHNNMQCAGESRITQLLLNIEDGYGHIVVMLGSAANLVRRCNEHCEPAKIAKFQTIYYGMADAEDAAENSLTNCEPERYLQMVDLGAVEQAGNPQLTTDAVSIHTELKGYSTGDVDVNESTLLTLINTQETLAHFRQVAQRILLITDRRGHGNLDSTRDMGVHEWHKTRAKRNTDGSLEMKSQPYLIRSAEHNKIGEAMVLAANIRISSTKATLPTGIGRVRDLGDE